MLVSAIVLSGFFTLLILTKRSKVYSDYLLFGWFLCTGLHLYVHYLYLQDSGTGYPSLVVSGFSLPLVHGPFLFLYTRSQLTALPFRFRELMHFMPFVLSLLLFCDFHFFSFEQKVKVFGESGRGFETRLAANLTAIYISGVVYIVLSLLRYFKYRKNIVHRFSNTEKIKMNWLLYLIIWMIIIWAAILITRNDYFIFGAASLFVLWLGYFGIKQVKIFESVPVVESLPDLADSSLKENSSEEDTFKDTEKEMENRADSVFKYSKSGLSQTDLKNFHHQLKTILREQKPYLNSELRLDDLAAALNITTNHLSQVINTQENKSFYDLVNEYRINEFKRRFSDPANQKFTILAIAYDCGFNSKASFNRNFKKVTGYTPSEYQKILATQD